MVSNAGGDFAGKPSELIAQALKLDAHNVLALWLAGSSEFQKSRYRSALRYWEQAQSQLSLESENAPILQQAIAEARARLASPKNKSP
jgi:cytochrome c-type biogenesis protein CcmH